MAENIGKQLRLAEWFNVSYGGAILVDMTISGAEGAVTGLEDPGEAVDELGCQATGLIVNPGQMERLASRGRLPGKRGAAPLVRVDWTNALRPSDFIAPMRKARRVLLSSAEDAMDLGADAIVTYLLMGLDEDFEAENIQSFAFLARESARLGLPLVADIQLVGPKVGKVNFADAVKLGVAQAVEGGADAFIIPDPGEEALAMIRRFSPVPVLLRVEGKGDSNKGGLGDAGLDKGGLDEGSWASCFNRADGVVFAGREFWASTRRVDLVSFAREAREAGGTR